MRITRGISYGALAAVITACGGGDAPEVADAPAAEPEQVVAAPQSPAGPTPPPAVAVLRNLSGSEVGSINFRQEGNEVVIEINARNLEGGDRAIHIHDVGVCEPPFESAGGHFNPLNREHGLDNPAGPHAGDLPNMHIDPDDGIGRDVFRTDRVTLYPGQPNSLLDGDGTAIVIHAGRDDGTSQPAGNSGDRIVCGVITAAP